MKSPILWLPLAAVLVGYAVGAVTALLIIRSSQEELVVTGEPAA